MSSCVFWTAADGSGTNPFGRPGNFEYRIWYEIDHGDEDFMPAARIEIIALECVGAQFGNEPKRRPTHIEKAALETWFTAQLSFDTEMRQEINHLAFEYAYVDAPPGWID